MTKLERRRLKKKRLPQSERLKEIISLIGVPNSFGRLTIIKFLGSEKTSATTSSRRKVLCRCDCGNEKEFKFQALKTGTKSCGCLLIKATTTHGLSSHPLHSVWTGMKERCKNKNHPCFKHYGGRGISVCVEWDEDFKVFYDWAMNNGWEKGLQIDRRENDLGYNPKNCRIVTGKVNANNKRYHHWVEYNGQVNNLSEWAEILKINYNTLRNRIVRAKMSMHEAVTTKKNYSGSKRNQKTT